MENTFWTAFGASLLGGYVLLHLFNRFITAFVCERRPEAAYGIGLVPMLGMGFHSFIDGVVYSITFTVSLFTGALAAGILVAVTIVLSK